MSSIFRLYSYATKIKKLQKLFDKRYLPVTRENVGEFGEEVVFTKVELREEITGMRAELKAAIINAKADIVKAVYIAGLIQVVAIVGSVIAIINFLAK